MKIGIDASNLRNGGGITHLKEFLRAIDPIEHQVDKVIVWACNSLKVELPKKDWLEIRTNHYLEKSLALRLYWQTVLLENEAKDCDILFVPGGLYLGKFRPFVTMCRNMLPFEYREMLRYGLSKTLMRMLLLRFLQKKTFQRAQGVIFLTQYAKNIVSKQLKKPLQSCAVIPHGVSERFHLVSREMRLEFSVDNPFVLLYVSNIDVYKHQWNVIQAVSEVKKKFPIKLQLIGRVMNSVANKKFKKALNKYDPDNNFVEYLGEVAHDQLSQYYHKADGFIFASSCENLPNILLEAMSAGLPILSSNRGPMPSVLGDEAAYFNPIDVRNTVKALVAFIESECLSDTPPISMGGSKKMNGWKKCADQTLGFIKTPLGIRQKHAG